MYIYILLLHIYIYIYTHCICRVDCNNGLISTLPHFQVGLKTTSKRKLHIYIYIHTLYIVYIYISDNQDDKHITPSLVINQLAYPVAGGPLGCFLIRPT